MKPRKWSNLDGQVPAEPEKKLSPREIKVRKEMDERRNLEMKNLAEEYKSLAEEEEFASLEDKARSVKYEALERIIWDRLRKIEEMSGQDTWRGEGQLFSPQFTPIPIVEDKDKLMQHIKDTHQEALLTIESNRLRSLVGIALAELVAMSPAQRAECGRTLERPLPGIKVFLKKGVHRSET